MSVVPAAGEEQLLFKQKNDLFLARLRGQWLRGVSRAQAARPQRRPSQGVETELALGHCFVPSVIHQVLGTSVGAHDVGMMSGSAHVAGHGVQHPRASV